MTYVMLVVAVILVAGLFWVQLSIHPIKTTLKAVFMVMAHRAIYVSILWLSLSCAFSFSLARTLLYHYKTYISHLRITQLSNDLFCATQPHSFH